MNHHYYECEDKIFLLISNDLIWENEAIYTEGSAMLLWHITNLGVCLPLHPQVPNSGSSVNLGLIPNLQLHLQIIYICRLFMLQSILKLNLIQPGLSSYFPHIIILSRRNFQNFNFFPWYSLYITTENKTIQLVLGIKCPSLGTTKG